MVGAGIAGIAAALEAASAGASVILVETSSVPGGHAVKAGGFALVGTPLQEKKGLQDSAEIAYADLMSWGEDADPDWVRTYAEKSRVEVYDWLTGMGVQFAVVLDTPEDSVPRFHFTRGTAINAVVPMLRALYSDGNIRFLANSRAEGLVSSAGAVTGIRIRNTRSGAAATLRATSVVLATGGFQSNLDLVRANWPSGMAQPARLLIGAGHEATGSGIELGQSVGARLARMDHQVTFVNGLPDPRRPGYGLNAQNTAAIWVDAAGRRFVNESADSKTTEAAGLELSPATHWLIFDSRGRRNLRVRGSAWLNPDTITAEILDNPQLTSQASNLDALADAAGLPAEALRETIERYNRAVSAGEDLEFGRFSSGAGNRAVAPIAAPPFYAMQLLPMTRKSMGGLAIDAAGRVLASEGQPVGGLFAAGELTGVAGINGSHGGSGTFLGPSVFIGRIAGRSAAPADPERDNPIAASQPASPRSPWLDAPSLSRMLERPRAGYWHFEKAHGLVIEKQYACARCHSEGWPTAPASGNAQKLLQLDSCSQCH